MTRRSTPPSWFFAAATLLFFVSGATSLVYEVAWVKILTLELGSSAWSVSMVIASFMAGLGAGSAYAGRRCERLPRPLKTYGQLEAGIALFALLSVPLLSSMGGILGPLYRLFEGHFFLFLLVRFVLSFVVLFIPTFLMGASLPVLVAGLAGQESFTRRVALLYGINTLGAAGGVVFGGLIALPGMGITGTVLFTVVVGFGIAAVAFWLDRHAPARVPSTSREEQPVAVAAPRSLIVALFMTGCLSIFYQVAWTRLLVPVVGSSTYAFSIILATFLVGIAIGSLIAAIPWFRRFSETSLVAGAMVFTSFTVLFGLFLVNQLPQMFGALALGIGDRIGVLFLSQAVVAGSLILLPTCGMGAALPLAISAWRSRTGNAGAAVGGIYAANTLGAILGSLLAGFMFLPWLGPTGSTKLAAFVGVIAAGVLFVLNAPTRPVPRVIGAGAMTFAMALLFLVLPELDVKNLQQGAFRSVLANDQLGETRMDLMYVREGTNATVTVLRSPRATALKVNGKTDASTGGDVDTQYLCAHYPMLLHPDPREACIIGFGSGATAHAVVSHPGVMQVDVVEIEKAVVDAAEYFDSINHGVLGDPRVHLHLEDGRTFLRYREKQYDVIISEPSNPWIVGVSSLFTSEFYREVRARLRPGGFLCQWIQYYEMSTETLGVMLHTLAAEFGHVVVFAVGGDLICVASEQPVVSDPDRIASIMKHPQMARSLKRCQVDNVYDLFCPVRQFFPENASMFQAKNKNTDDNLWLEYRAPVEMYVGTDPKMKWLPGKQYMDNVQRLLPGVERRDIAVPIARSLFKKLPELGVIFGDLAGPVSKDDPVRQELSKLAAAANKRVSEMEGNDDRLREAARFLKTGDHEKVIPLTRRIVASEPYRAQAHRLLGWSLIKTGEGKAGLRHLLIALEIQPDDYEALTRLGAISLGADEGDRYAYLKKALELNPRYLPAWRIYLRGLLEDEVAENQLARFFEDAERILPDSEYSELLSDRQKLESQSH